MTRSETIGIIELIRRAYPHFLEQFPQEADMKKTVSGVVDLWEEMFKDDAVSIVAATVKSYIVSDERGFPPHIGAIKSKIYKLVTQKEMSELDTRNAQKLFVRLGYERDTRQRIQEQN